MTGPFTPILETFVETAATVKVQRTASAQPLARTLADDLDRLIERHRLDLAAAIGVPRGRYLNAPKHLATLLDHDIAAMLRDRLITGVHLLLAEDHPESNTIPLLAHLHYTLSHNDDTLDAPSPPDTLSMPTLSATSATLASSSAAPSTLPDIPTTPAPIRLAILLDWDPQAPLDDIRSTRRPRYLFDWSPVNEQPEAASLVTYHGTTLITHPSLIIEDSN